MADCPSLDCFYSILGVQKDSSSVEIRTAYRELAMRWHPDKCSGAKAEVQEQAKRKFQKVQEAYQVLSDDEQRLLYDTGLYGATKQTCSYECLAREFVELQKLFFTLAETRNSCKRSPQMLNVPASVDSNDSRMKRARCPQPISNTFTAASEDFPGCSSTASWHYKSESRDLPSSCDSPKPHPKLSNRSICDDPEIASLLYEFDQSILEDSSPSCGVNSQTGEKQTNL